MNLRHLLDRASTRPLLVACVVAAVVRVVVAVATFVLVDGPVIPDEQQYVDLAGVVASGRSAESWATGYGQSLYDATWAFTAPLAALFRVLPDSRIVGQLLAAAFGVATVGVVTRTALEWLRPRHAMVAGAIVALLPSQVLWSTAALRESAAWLALATMGLGVTLAVRRSGWPLVRCAVPVAAGVAALAHLREQTMVAACIALVLAVAVIRAPQRLLRVGGAIAIATLVPWAAGLGPAGWDVVDRALPELGRTRTYLALDAESAFTSTSLVVPRSTTTEGPRSTTTEGPRDPTTGPPVSTTTSTSTTTTTTSTTIPAPEEAETVIVSNSGEVYVVDASHGANLRSLPPGLLAVTLRPFPWDETTSTPVRMAKIENVVWFGLYALAAIGVALSLRRRALVAFPTLTLGVIVGIAAVTQGNLGTAFRHRAQVLWCLALLAAAGTQALADRRAQAPATER